MSDPAGPVRVVNLRAALESFDELWSPRIVGRMNDVDVKVAKVQGEHLWHVHESTDELFLVLEGMLHISMRDDAGAELRVSLGPLDTFTVPRGTEHRPESPGASILLLEPAGTLSTGDRHQGEVPAEVDSTTGRGLDSGD